MWNIEKLRASCKKVLERHVSDYAIDLPCVICQQLVRGLTNSMEHYDGMHGVRMKNFDDVVDIEGFLSHMRSLLRPADDACLHCPVCGVACGDAEALRAHIEQLQHTSWDTKSISTLASFCITSSPCCPEVRDCDEGCSNDDENGEKAFEGDDDDDFDGEEDWEEEPALCLLCDTTSHDCLLHMKEAHSFDFVAAVQQHGGVCDVYDVIRVVNVIRSCIANGKCPYHYEEECPEAAFCHSDISSSSVLSHLKRQPHHAIPRVVPKGDNKLIPRIPGDAFISAIVANGNFMFGGGKGNIGEDEEDYPMVPTIVELARRRAAEERKHA